MVQKKLLMLPLEIHSKSIQTILTQFLPRQKHHNQAKHGLYHESLYTFTICKQVPSLKHTLLLDVHQH